MGPAGGTEATSRLIGVLGVVERELAELRRLDDERTVGVILMMEALRREIVSALTAADGG